MFYVYVLKSIKDEDLYIGLTNDLRRRLSEHNNSQVLSTKTRTPFELRYYEAYHSKYDARRREQALKKRGNARKQLELRISGSLL